MAKKKFRILIVASDFYSNITSKMIISAEEELKKNKCSFDILRVNGSLESTMALNELGGEIK